MAAGKLGIRFERFGDRYGHIIEVTDSHDVCFVLHSCEGEHTDGWPLSPPLQQLHVEQRGAGRQVALLVGMSGRDHWSLSAETDSVANTLTFDVACKSSRGSSLLRSTYKIPGGATADVRRIDADTLTVGTLRFELVPLPGILRGAILHEGDEIRVIPAPTDLVTYRWKYRLSTLTTV